ncbi:MAG: AIPR family protein [candidate division WOR-3 bacterium]|nr:AIPR family protein [candidate division WOR-3 bacterium]
MLFNKNIRLSLLGTKEGRERLRNPMEQTLEDIAGGRLSPSIFTFYHTGVTIAAATAEPDSEDILMEVPSIINGCQTITIAGEFLTELEKKNKPDAVNLFNQIKVIAKVIVGTTDEELREVTNANNRQIPIEPWQLFSNEPIHIEIEAALKERGVFYERQKGKFDTVMKRPDVARSYPKTNGGYIKLVELAQVISLFRRNMQWAAKPSEVFVNGERHASIFDQSIPGYPQDIILGVNLLKAMRRGLSNYLSLPAHAEDAASAVLLRPLVSAYLFHIGMLHFYQNDKKSDTLLEFSEYLSKIASSRLVGETQTFYQKVVTKTKSWYRGESKGLTTVVSGRSMDKFFTVLAIELGVDMEQGLLPFGPRSRTRG